MPRSRVLPSRAPGIAHERIQPLGTPVEFYEHNEAEALYAAVELLSGPKWRTLVELGTQVGPRPGELSGLHGHRVDWLRGKIQIIDVMTRLGLRQWPKSKKSHRIVPAPPHIMEGMSLLMTGRPRDALVFTAPEGGPVTDGHFRDRVWYPARPRLGCAARRPASPAHNGAGRRPAVIRSTRSAGSPLA